MPKLASPLQLSPVFKEKIWGRADLSPVFESPKSREREGSTGSRFPGTAPGKQGLIGEVWLTADESRFLNGAAAGLTLTEACGQYGSDLVGECCASEPHDALRFPVLAKYLFTSDWLSVQVHPDNEYASQHEPGNLGKCEMWYIVDAQPKARYLLGTRPGVTLETFGAACQKGASRPLLREFRPKQNEAVFIPPGTLHALGPGLVLFEVEQNSDITYRLDDFGRKGSDGKPRPLHLERGLDAARLEAPVYGPLPELIMRESFGTRRIILACRFFALEELMLRRAALFSSSPRRVEVLSLLEGEGRIENEAGWMPCHTGDTWVIPPAGGKYRLIPFERMRLLKFYVPDLAKDFAAPQERQRLSSKKLQRICFD